VRRLWLPILWPLCAICFLWWKRVQTFQSMINICKRKFHLFYEQLHVTFEEKVCHLTWHHFITIKICFCFNKRLSIRKMYLHPLSCGCAFQIIIFVFCFDSLSIKVRAVTKSILQVSWRSWKRKM
jgi:hypothetical protein